MRNAQHCAHPIFIWLSVILLIHDNTIAAVFAASQTVRMLPVTPRTMLPLYSSSCVQFGRVKASSKYTAVFGRIGRSMCASASLCHLSEVHSEEVHLSYRKLTPMKLHLWSKQSARISNLSKAFISLLLFRQVASSSYCPAGILNSNKYDYVVYDRFPAHILAREKG